MPIGHCGDTVAPHLLRAKNDKMKKNLSYPEAHIAEERRPQLDLQYFTALATVAPSRRIILFFTNRWFDTISDS